MFDIGWPELLVVGAVALVAVGPKDLPKVMYALGRMANKAKMALHDIQALIDHAEMENKRAKAEEKEEAEKEEAEK